MPTTISLASRHMNAWRIEGAAARTSYLDFAAVAGFAVTGLLLSLAFASLFPISADIAFLMASFS